MPLPYPEEKRERDAWVLEQRGARAASDAARPYGYLHEWERTAEGRIAPTVTIFLTNRECPWRCVMCDLWKNTVAERVPRGAIPAQIDYALERLPPGETVKLYNSGSFFDSGAIPPEDYPAIAERVRPFRRVVVESHPALIGERTTRFRDLIPGRLEVAMGLETADPMVLEKLNKGMTVESYARAAEWLRANGVDLRAFVMVKPPFTGEGEAVDWARRSASLAFDCGATAVVLIPARGGNGAMEILREARHFSPPALSTVEAAQERGLELGRGRVFVDCWDMERIATCAACRAERVARLEAINLEQIIRPAIVCAACENGAAGGNGAG